MGTRIASRRLPIVLTLLAVLAGLGLVPPVDSQEPGQVAGQNEKVEPKAIERAAQAPQEKQKEAEEAKKQAQVKEQPPGEAPPAPPAIATAPESALAPPPTVAPTTAAGASGFSSLAPPSGEALRANPVQTAALQTPGASGASGTQAQVLGSTDTGDFLSKSQSFTGIETQKRSPIANEARIRGEHLGQIVTQADGAFWFPARQDLDTFLSKIDSGSIKNVVVLKGPYSARYGPGFSFIDIATEGTPFFDKGFDWSGRSVFSYKTNGQQLYGRQDLAIGDPTWGARVSYGQRTATDYMTGDDTRIPSSFNVRDLNAVVGHKLSPDSTIEFGYMRLDQTDLDFPGQIFDTDFLITNAFRGRYTIENQDLFDRFVLDGFYNRTSMKGNAQEPDKRQQIPGLNNFLTSGITHISQSSAGYRAAMTWGKCEKENQFTLGTDFRYLIGQLREDDVLFTIPCAQSNFFGIPPSHHSTVGGIFVEDALPVNQDLTIKTGGRVDFVNTDVDAIPSVSGQTAIQTCHALQSTLQTTDFERDYTLFLAYVTGDYKFIPNWSLQGGFGHAQRAPTTTELYAIEPFLAVLQNGGTIVTGNPHLASEKLYQIDLGLKADYERVRLGLNGFYSWIADYITFQATGASQKGIDLSTNLSNALAVRFVNTGLATLAGFETYGEWDATDWLTPFATVSYVDGRDHNRADRGDTRGGASEPLPGIAPLESRLGLRFHEARREGPRYGVEWSARLAAEQNRVASSLNELRSPGFTIFDLRSYWQWRKGVLLTGGVENMFDRNYREHLDLRTGRGVFQPGANGYFGVELRY